MEIVHQSHDLPSQPPPPIIEDRVADRIFSRNSAPTDNERDATQKILESLKKAGGNKAKAARILKIDRSTLYRKMRELHIDISMFDL